jgi:hypothetical protein
MRWMKSRFRRDSDAAAIDRAFTVCISFEGVNNLHPYEPPFGLAQYDDRFRSQAQEGD